MPTEELKALEIEADTYHDLALLPISETYATLTEKLLSSFTWIMANKNSTAIAVFKVYRSQLIVRTGPWLTPYTSQKQVDDDTFVLKNKFMESFQSHSPKVQCVS